MFGRGQPNLSVRFDFIYFFFLTLTRVRPAEKHVDSL